MIKNILIPLDGSEHSKAALDYAVWLARGFDGKDVVFSRLSCA